MAQTTGSSALARVAERFEKELPVRLDAMEGLAADLSADTDAQTFTDIERIIHNLCGTAPVFGYTDLGAYAVEIEDLMISLRSGGAKVDESNVSKLKAMLFHLRAHANNGNVE